MLCIVFVSDCFISEHLAGPFEDGVLNERVRSMPCKFLPPSTKRKSGVIMLGDAFNMRHPLTGLYLNLYERLFQSMLYVRW